MIIFWEKPKFFFFLYNTRKKAYLRNVASLWKSACIFLMNDKRNTLGSASASLRAASLRERQATDVTFSEKDVVEQLHLLTFLVLSLLVFFNFGVCLFFGKPVSIPLLHLQSVNNIKVLSRSLYSTFKSLNLAASLPFL